MDDTTCSDMSTTPTCEQACAAYAILPRGSSTPTSFFTKQAVRLEQRLNPKIVIATLCRLRGMKHGTFDRAVRRAPHACAPAHADPRILSPGKACGSRSLLLFT